jgi:hypothetical protein
VFIAVVLLTLAASFLYHSFRSLFSGLTSWDELVTSSRWKPAPTIQPDGIFLSVIHHSSADPEAARERLHFLVEYLQTNLPDRNFEVLCFANPAVVSAVGGQFPQARFLTVVDPSRTFTFATFRALGAFIVDGSHIET